MSEHSTTGGLPGWEFCQACQVYAPRQHEVRMMCDRGASAPTLQPFTSEANRLRAWLQNIVDVHDARSELFTSEAECAASLVDRARAALGGKSCV